MRLDDAIKINGKVRRAGSTIGVYAKLIEGRLTWIYPTGTPLTEPVSFGYHFKNDWEAYVEVIKPKNVSEVWEHEDGSRGWTYNKEAYSRREKATHLIFTNGVINNLDNMTGIVDGKNGWSRVLPEVK